MLHFIQVQPTDALSSMERPAHTQPSMESPQDEEQEEEQESEIDSDEDTKKKLTAR